MASEGPNSPGTVADEAGVGTETWTNPSNATSSNDSRASVTVKAFVFPESHYLKATNFGFSIPAGATIDGIVVEIERYRSGGGGAGTCADYRVRIVKGGTIGSTDKSSGVNWTGTEAYFTYGGSSDLWGETWSESDIEDSGFGVALAVGQGSGSADDSICQVDHMRITVHYTEAGGAAATCMALLGVGV